MEIFLSSTTSHLPPFIITTILRAPHTLTHLNSGRIPIRQDCRQPAILLDKLGAAGDAPVAIVKEGVRSRRPSGDVACPHERVRTPQD